MNTSILTNMIMNNLMPSVEGQVIIKDSVYEFANTFDTPNDPELWYSLVVEEVFEFYEEFVLNGVTPNLLKEYADVLYVIAGFIRLEDTTDYAVNDKQYYKLLNTLQFAEDVVLSLFSTKLVMEAFERVHLSNMSKLDKDGNVLRHASGKVMKSDLYQKPNLNDLINKEEMIQEAKTQLGA